MAAPVFTQSQPTRDRVLDADGTVTRTWSRFFDELWRRAPRSGVFTLAAAVTTSVSRADVLGASIVHLTPTNAAAATLMGSAKSLYVSAMTTGVGFTVHTANGVAAAGTETFSFTVRL